MDCKKIFSPIKDTWVCKAVSLVTFVILWMPLIAFFALRVWDFLLLMPLFILFKRAGSKKEIMRYLFISLLIMAIPVYFIEHYFISEEIERRFLENCYFLPQTANGIMAWLLYIPWIGSFVPFFLMDYSRKRPPKKTAISFILAWGIIIAMTILNYGFCF